MSLVGRKGQQVQVLPPDVPRGHEPLIGVKLQLFNRRMRKRREECNLSQGQLAQQTGISQAALSMIELLKRVPTVDEMNLIATALYDEPDHMFPDAIRELKRDTKIAPELYLAPDGIRLVTPTDDPDALLRLVAGSQVLAGLLPRLTPRERMTLEVRYGLETGVPTSLREAADRMGVTPERLRQIEAKALNELYAHAVHGIEARVLCPCWAEIVIRPVRMARRGLAVRHGAGSGRMVGGKVLYGNEAGGTASSADEIVQWLDGGLHNPDAWERVDTTDLRAELVVAFERVNREALEAEGQ